MIARTRTRNKSPKPIPGEYSAFGYASADELRKSGRVIPYGGSGDYHLRYDRRDLVRQSEAFYRDNGLYEGIVNRAVDNILGEGFGLQARTSNADINQVLEDLWREFALAPEIRGMDSWSDCERLALTSLFVEGDFTSIKTNTGKIQIIESELVASNRKTNNGNRVELGVEVSAVGTPIAYWIANYDINGQLQTQDSKSYSADDIIFLANRKRITQTRGIPVMTSNFPMFHRINDICDSEAVAWQLLARMALSINRENAEQKATLRSNPDPNNPDDKTSPPGVQDRIQDFDYGMIFHGEVGETIAGIERNIPSANFTDSLIMFIRLLGLPVGFPLELILLDFSKTTYSSARASLEQAFRMFATWQKRLRVGFHSPVYTWKVRQWVNEKIIPDLPDILKHEWLSPSFPWIDQLKEAEAWGERIDRNFATLSQACKSLNQDRAEQLAQRAREVEEAIILADELNKKHPNARVDWHIFAGMGSAPTVTEKIMEDAPGQVAQAPAKASGAKNETRKSS